MLLLTSTTGLSSVSMLLLTAGMMGKQDSGFEHREVTARNCFRRPWMDTGSWTRENAWGLAADLIQTEGMRELSWAEQAAYSTEQNGTVLAASTLRSLASSGQNRKGERTLTRGFSVRRSHSSKTGHRWEMSATPSTLPTPNTGPRPPPLALVHLRGCGHSHLLLCRVIWCTRAVRCRICSAIGESARLELHFFVDWRDGKLKEDNASHRGGCLRRAKLPPRPFGPPGPSPAKVSVARWLG